MLWRQCTLRPGEDWTAILDTVSEWSPGMAAARGFALFMRSTDAGDSMLLLSPGSHEVAALLPGKWPETRNPEQFEWFLLFGPTNSFEHYGLRRGNALGGSIVSGDGLERT